MAGECKDWGQAGRVMAKMTNVMQESLAARHLALLRERSMGDWLLCSFVVTTTPLDAEPPQKSRVTSCKVPGRGRGHARCVCLTAELARWQLICLCCAYCRA